MKLLLPIVFIFTTAVMHAQGIGHLSYMVTDPNRNNREVTAEIYYPAASTGDNVPVSGTNLPVIVFGHGFVMQYSVYDNIWNALVPEGYICAFLTTESGIAPSHQDYGLDFVFIKNSLQNEGNNVSSSPFYQTVGTSSAYMGHSMGGGATILAGQADATVTTLIGLAAAETNPSAIDAAAEVNAPTLILAGSADPVTPPDDHQIPIYNTLNSSCKALVTITGGGHCYFANSGSPCEIGEFGTSFTINRQQQQTLANTFIIPWLRYWLKNDGTAFYNFNNLLTETAGITHNETCAALTILSQTKTESFKLYPNPAQDILFIESNKGENEAVNYLLMNNLGAAVMQGVLPAGNSGLALPNLPAGMYTLRISNNTQQTHFKFIKN